MKAVRFYAKEDVRYDDVKEPGDILPGQVLVKPTFCGICGTDLHEFTDGPIWTPKPRNRFSGAELPQILGHEFAATVVEVGRDVRGLQRGDRVSIQPQVGPRGDYFGRQGLFQLSRDSAVIGLSWPWGGMAEYAVVNDYNAFKLPDNVSDEQGAMIEPAAVAVQAIDRARVKTGDTVLVTGGGPIGALVALAARTAGAAKVFITEPSAARRARLERLGVLTAALDPSAPGALGGIRAQTEEGVGVDVAVECAGNAAALATCIDAVRGGGAVVQVGILHGGAKLDPFQWVLKDLTIHGSLAYPINIWPRIIAMIASGAFPVEKLIDRRIKAAGAVEEGFRPLIEQREPLLKVLIGL